VGEIVCTPKDGASVFFCLLLGCRNSNSCLSRLLFSRAFKVGRGIFFSSIIPIPCALSVALLRSRFCRLTTLYTILPNSCTTSSVSIQLPFFLSPSVVMRTVHIPSAPLAVRDAYVSTLFGLRPFLPVQILSFVIFATAFDT
jgi:hypothetical protein